MTWGRTGFLTVNRCLPRQDDDHQLEALVGVLEVPEHGLHAVGSLGILTEAGLTLDGHPCIPRDLPQLICECSETDALGCHYKPHTHKVRIHKVKLFFLWNGDIIKATLKTQIIWKENIESQIQWDNLKGSALTKMYNMLEHLTYLSRSSVHCLCGAKQAMAHTLISIPVWNCLFLMSHTPWIGVAIALFCKL